MKLKKGVFKMCHNFRYSDDTDFKTKVAVINEELSTIKHEGYDGIVTNAAFADGYLKNSENMMLLEETVRICDKIGLRVWIYDEKYYPSGAAGTMTLENCLFFEKGKEIEFSFSEPASIKAVRLAFDPDYSRKSVSPNLKMQRFAQKLNTGRDFVPVKVPATIVKSFSVYADGQCVYQTEKNYHSLVVIPVERKCRKLSVRFDETNGADQIHLFACDLT